jgi:hypothetical protein
MTKVKDIYQKYQEHGVMGTLIAAWIYFLCGSYISPYIKRILGKELHQKLYVYPQIGYWPDIQDPNTFNENILHRKVHTNKDIFSKVEDKYRAREYVKKKVGGEILPELYYETKDPTTIPFDDLPSEFVVKPTHLTGGKAIIVTDENNIDNDYIVESCDEWLSQIYGSVKGEYWYSEIEPRIIIEEYIDDERYKAPIDYKFMVFHGEVKFIHAIGDRKSSNGTFQNFYDKEWNQIPFELTFPSGPPVERPELLSEMIDVSEKLGEDFEHIRVDLYSPNNERIVFGELTVAESSGSNPFVPQKYDEKFGEYW